MAPLLLVLRDLGLGDLLTGLPALRALARHQRGRERVLVSPDWLAPLTSRLGLVDSVASDIDPGWEVGLGVNLHGSGPESHRRVLGSRPARLVAFHHPLVPEASDSPRWDDREHEVYRWCRLLDSHGIPADPSDLDLPFRFPRADLTIVHPGAGVAAKRWPVERFVEVARSEAEKGRPVVVTGGPREERLAEQVVAGAGLPARANLAGRTTVWDLVELIGSAGRIVCGDTGAAHLATALRTPSVVLFGPVSPSLWGPPPDRWWHIPLWSGKEGDRFGSSPDRGLLEIEVVQVREALDRLPHWREVPPVELPELVR